MYGAIRLVSLYAFVAWTRERGKIFKSISCLKGNKCSVTAPSPYSFLLNLLLLLLLLHRLILHVSFYVFICGGFCCMLLKILHLFVDMLLNTQQILSNNLYRKTVIQ
jgi:hypothetical protein